MAPPAQAEPTTDDMVALPGGRFAMGSTAFYPEEGPVHDATVGPFSIDRHPVTVAEFHRFVVETGYVTVAERPLDPAVYSEADPALLVPGSLVFTPTQGPVSLDDPMQWWRYVPGTTWRMPGGPGTTVRGRLQHPVTQVAFEDALAYATWAGKDLPTEAEWEYAARGGLDGATFTWGNEPPGDDEVLANTWHGRFPWENLGAAGHHGTSPAGAFPANGFGLFDMCGNVWEWTTDVFATRHAAAGENSCCGPRAVAPPEPSDGTGIPRHVIKGGSHLCAPSYCLRFRPAARQGEAIDTATSHIGFRCVRREPAG